MKNLVLILVTFVLFGYTISFTINKGEGVILEDDNFTGHVDVPATVDDKHDLHVESVMFSGNVVTFTAVTCKHEGPIETEECKTTCNDKGYTFGLCTNFKCNCV